MFEILDALQHLRYNLPKNQMNIFKRLEPLRSHENPAVRFESVHKAENLEKKLREAEFFHQQEIQEYQNHIKSLEYTIQNKDSELQMMYNQANKMQQELETTNSRIRTYEVGYISFL